MPSVRFRLNGAETEVDADPDRSLLDILRGQLNITGAHFGCGAGECGACNVIIGDRAVSACDTPLWSVADKDVTTVEGLGTSERPHPLQRASKSLHAHPPSRGAPAPGCCGPVGPGLINWRSG